MCLAVPGKIVEINEDIAVIDYGSEKREAKLIEKFSVGDYVIVQAKIVVEKVPEDRVKAWLELYNES